MSDEELIDYTNPDTIARQNIAPNAGCNIDGKFYDVRNLVHLASSQADRIEALEAKLARAVEVLNALDATLDRNDWPFARIAQSHIRATLAEIKGE